MKAPSFAFALTLGLGLLLVGLFCLTQVPAPAQLLMTGVGAAGTSGFTPSCSQSTAFLARTSGQDTTHKAAYDTLICGLVNTSSTISGSLWSRLDVLYMLRAADSTVALLDLTANALNLSPQGTYGGGGSELVFVANAGVTSNGTTGYFKTGYNPTVLNKQFQRDSASFMVCATAAFISVDTEGAYDGTVFMEMRNNTLASDNFYINNSSPTAGTAVTAGLYHGSRTAGPSIQAYYNGSADGPADTSATVANLNIEVYFMARNFLGSPDSFPINAVQRAMYALGAGFSAADAANFRTLVAAYMASLGTAAC